MSVYIVIQEDTRTISFGWEDDEIVIPKVVAVAASHESAQEWINKKIEWSLNLVRAHNAGASAVAEWEKTLGPVFDEPQPTITKWPAGVGQKEPRYAALEARRKNEMAALTAWQKRKTKALGDHLAAANRVFREAIMDFNISDEDILIAPNYRIPLDLSCFKIEVWDVLP